MDTDKLLAKYQVGHHLLLDQLEGIPQEAISFKPSDGSWSIGEVIVHLADAEAHGFVRAKKIIAECGGQVCTYNHQIWADHLFYEEMDYLDALDLIRIVRKNLLPVLRKISEKEWQNYIYHPESGKITLSDWILLHIDHIDIHIKQIHRIFYQWKKAQKKEYV